MTIAVDHLAEVPVPIRKGDGDERHLEVRCGAEEVPRQHSKAAAVGGEPRVEGDLHTEIRDPRQWLRRAGGRRGRGRRGR